MISQAHRPAVRSNRIVARSDLFLAGAVVGVIAMMIIPLPTGLLDILIILNITLSLTVLLVSLNVREPLEFGSFPSLLLLATLFRLGLNVSAVRLILLEAHAGAVINAFGNIVVGGNTIVGVVVFLILVIIQFVVITNGAGRVSEVSARFTLDAMPGKQMSIDADLNAGLITAEDARARRRAIEREADFYGAMDGASKFVKGDAIAAMVIIVVNIVGGLTVGIVQMGFSVGDAITQYTVLTVGEGLVSQIGALLMSVATGILVTRGLSEDGLGADLASSLLAWPRLFVVVGGTLALIGIVPGFPTGVMVASGAAVAGLGVLLSRRPSAAPVMEPPAQLALNRPAETPGEGLQLEILELELGYGLVGLVDASDGINGGLVERVGLVRRQIATDLGLIVPTVRIRDDIALEPDAYVIRLRGAEIAHGRIDPARLLAMVPAGGELAIDGVPTTEPVFGMPAVWIGYAERERADALGYTIVDPASVLATHLAETIRRHAHEILGRHEVHQMLERLKTEQPSLVEELVPNVVTVGDIQKVLQGLLEERISIRDLASICEAVGDAARTTKEPLLLIEATRHRLARPISMRYRSADGTLHAVALAPALDTRLGGSLIVQPGYLGLDLGAAEARAVLDAIEAAINNLTSAGHDPILLCTSRIRRAVHGLTERKLPQLSVLAYEEIVPSVPVDIHAQVEV
jgi:flagellar biosynthesis protein FlhA